MIAVLRRVCGLAQNRQNEKNGLRNELMLHEPLSEEISGREGCWHGAIP